MYNGFAITEFLSWISETGRSYSFTSTFESKSFPKMTFIHIFIYMHLLQNLMIIFMSKSIRSFVVVIDENPKYPALFSIPFMLLLFIKYKRWPAFALDGKRILLSFIWTSRLKSFALHVHPYMQVCVAHLCQSMLKLLAVYHLLLRSVFVWCRHHSFDGWYSSFYHDVIVL